MSATEELRKMLDERGVEYEEYAYVSTETQERYEVIRVRDMAGRVKARFMSCNEPGKVDVAVKLTPERAIAATLGSEGDRDAQRAEGGGLMSFGDGNLRERVEELEHERARLLASLLAATEGAHADWPALALDWDNTGDERKREWCQWLYEHAARQDGRIEALEQENGWLRSLARDMGAYIDGIANRTYTVNVAHGNDLLGRMAELGIRTEGGA